MIICCTKVDTGRAGRWKGKRATKNSRSVPFTYQITRPLSHKIKFTSRIAPCYPVGFAMIFVVKFWSQNVQVYMPLLRVVSSGYPKSSVWICPFAAEIEHCCWDCPKVPSSLCGGKSVVSLYLQSQFRARFLAGCFEAVPPRAVARSGSSTTRSSAKSDRIVPWGCSLVPGNSELSSTCFAVFRCTYYFSWPVIATRHLEGCWVLMPVSPMRPLVLNQNDS